MAVIENTHTLSFLVENRFGVLERIAALFSGRGYNISSLTVHATEDPRYSRMTVVSVGDDSVVDQVSRQARDLSDVVKVENLTGSQFVEREIALVKVKTGNRDAQSQLIQLADIFQGKIVSASSGEMVVEISGRADRIDSFMELVREFGIIDMARSGRVAIARSVNARKSDVRA